MEMVGPFASRLQSVVQEESKYFEVIRAVLVTHLHGNAPQVSVGKPWRKMSAPNEHMPSFVELEEAVQSVQVVCDFAGFAVVRPAACAGVCCRPVTLAQPRLPARAAPGEVATAVASATLIGNTHRQHSSAALIGSTHRRRGNLWQAKSKA